MIKTRETIRGAISASEIQKVYKEVFKVPWWQMWFGNPFKLADQGYLKTNETLIKTILKEDKTDLEEYTLDENGNPIEDFDCEVNLETAYGLGLFFADGSCGLRDNRFYGGAFWRIVGWKRACLERVKVAFEQEWVDMVFPIRLYDDYKAGSLTNYGERKKTLYCLEVAPRERHNDGSRGKFIERFRNTNYDRFSNKKVPAGILESPPISKRAFLEGAIDGDGSVSKTNYSGRLNCHGIMQATELIDLMFDCGWKFNFGRDNGHENYWITFRKGKKLRKTSACDDFAFRLMGVFHQNLKTAAMPIFITWVLIPQGGHAVLSYYSNGKVKIIEPQTDEVFDVPEDWQLLLLCG